MPKFEKNVLDQNGTQIFQLCHFEKTASSFINGIQILQPQSYFETFLTNSKQRQQFDDAHGYREASYGNDGEATDHYYSPR